MEAIEEIHQCNEGRIYIRVCRLAPGVWRGEVAGSEPILFELFETLQEAVRYFRGLVREALSCEPPGKEFRAERSRGGQHDQGAAVFGNVQD